MFFLVDLVLQRNKTCAMKTFVRVLCFVQGELLLRVLIRLFSHGTELEMHSIIFRIPACRLFVAAHVRLVCVKL